MGSQCVRVIGSVRATALVGLFAGGLPMVPLMATERAEINGTVPVTLSDQTYVRRLSQIEAGVVDGAKYTPSIAACRDGGYVIVWAGKTGKFQGTDVYVQRLDVLGRPMGEATMVNSTRALNQSAPAVAVDERGMCWIAWSSYRQDGDEGAIIARRFGITETGVNPATDEILVNSVTADEQTSPAIALSSDGGVMVSWISSPQNATAQAKARFINASGQAACDEFFLSSEDLGRVSVTTIASLPNGGFAAVWAQEDAQGVSGIFMRYVSHEGAAYPDTLRISGPDGNEHIEPSAAVDGAGQVTIAWMRSRAQITEGYDVVARQISSTGSTPGQAWVVSDSNAGWKTGATVAASDDGRIAVSYSEVFPVQADTLVQRPAAPSRIMTHLYDRQGRPIEDVVQMTPSDGESHILAAALPAARALWTDEDVLVVSHVSSRQQKGHALSLAMLMPASYTAPEEPSYSANWIREREQGSTIPPVFDPNWVPGEEEFGIASVGPDFGFGGPSANGWYPPDPDIAVGPNHLVTVVNGTVSFYDKAGNRTYNNCLSCFWAELGANGFVFDPIALWDTHSSRFIVAAAEAADNGDSYIDLAVSDDTDPNGTWHKYRVRTEQLGDFLDFPNLGVGPDAIFIAGDYFGSPSANQIHIFPKAPLLEGGAIELKNVQTTTYPVSLGAVKSYDADTPAQYFVSSYTAYPNLRIEAIRDATGTPVWNSFNLSVPSYGQPPGAPQKGTSNLASTVDFRIKNGVYRDGSLYACHAIAGIGVPKTRWYRIEMNGWPSSGQTPVLAEWGDIVMGTGIANWFADINVSDEGEVVMTMNRSSADEYISVQRVVKKVYDIKFRDPVTAQESTSPELGSRWGDYSGIDEDPSAPGVFWGLTEYRTSDWRTWVTRVDANKTMILSSSTLRAGQPGTLTATNCAQGGRVKFYFSRVGEGSTQINNLNVTLDIANAKLVGSATADANGVASLTRTVQAGTGNTVVWLQAAEFDNKSQVLLTQIN